MLIIIYLCIQDTIGANYSLNKIDKATVQICNANILYNALKTYE